MEHTYICIGEVGDKLGIFKGFPGKMCQQSAPPWWPAVKKRKEPDSPFKEVHTAHPRDPSYSWCVLKAIQRSSLLMAPSSPPVLLRTDLRNLTVWASICLPISMSTSLWIHYRLPCILHEHKSISLLPYTLILWNYDKHPSQYCLVATWFFLIHLNRSKHKKWST